MEFFPQSTPLGLAEEGTSPVRRGLVLLNQQLCPRRTLNPQSLGRSAGALTLPAGRAAAWVRAATAFPCPGQELGWGGVWEEEE